MHGVLESRWRCRAPMTTALSLVVAPESEDFDHALFGKHLIDKTVLDVDPARVRSREISDQLLVGRRLPERVFSKQVK